MDEPPIDPPLQDRQFRLQTAWGLLTACAITFAIVRSQPELSELSLGDWAQLTAYSLLVLGCLHMLLWGGIVTTPLFLAWLGTVAAGTIFGAFVGHANQVLNTGDMLLGGFVGSIIAFSVGVVGMNLAFWVWLILNTESPLVLGVVCGGSTGFMAVAIPTMFNAESFHLALAAAWLGAVVATYAVAVGKRSARRNNSAAISNSPSEPEPAPEPDPLRLPP